MAKAGRVALGALASGWRFAWIAAIAGAGFALLMGSNLWPLTGLFVTGPLGFLAGILWALLRHFSGGRTLA